jgi:hypothetical protein
MTSSENVNELATALAKAQGQISGAKKDAENPHFRSKYADLASVWDACREALTKNGLAIVQMPRGVHIEGGWAVEVETRMLHTSGQFMSETLTVPVTKPDAQGIGSAVTYARRYALAAFVGVAPEDDDGNAASATNGHAAARTPAKVPAGYDDWMTDMAATADNGTEALQAAWTKSKTEYRDYITKHQPTAWDAMKKLAASRRQPVGA